MIPIPSSKHISIALFAALGIAAYAAMTCGTDDPEAAKNIKRSEKVEAAYVKQREASARVDTVVDTLWLKEKSARSTAAALAAAGDTAGQIASSLRDSSSMWKLRWTFRGFAIDSLTSALTLSDIQKDSLHADRDRWKIVADSAVPAMQSLRADLKRATEKAECRVLFVRCIDRRWVAVGGIALGAYGGLKARDMLEDRRDKKR